MRWLIVEDALQDRKGHWFEYVRTFRRGLLELGDSVTVLASKKAEPFIVNELEARPVLPTSIWHRMSDGAGLMTRYGRVPWHAVQTWRGVRAALRTDDEYDIIFVPTVSVHHLLGWVRLIKGVLRNSCSRVLLYFLSTPIRIDADGNAQWIRSPTSRLLLRLLTNLRPEVERGKVAIGVETVPLQKALSQVAAIPVRYLPQPVEPFAGNTPDQLEEMLLGSYGPARHEKGSDILMAAIEKFLESYPDSRTRFAVQWLNGFALPDGKHSELPRKLEQHPRVEIIRRFFDNGEYGRRLSQTQAVVLPYRLSSYRLRGSRVGIEAMVHGIPMVATRGTAPAQQAEQFGAVVLCEDENVGSLVQAIHMIQQNFAALKERAEQQKVNAREHFSVRQFRDFLLAA